MRICFVITYYLVILLSYHGIVSASYVVNKDTIQTYGENIQLLGIKNISSEILFFDSVTAQYDTTRFGPWFLNLRNSSNNRILRINNCNDYPAFYVEDYMFYFEPNEDCFFDQISLSSIVPCVGYDIATNFLAPPNAIKPIDTIHVTFSLHKGTEKTKFVVKSIYDWTPIISNETLEIEKKNNLIKLLPNPFNGFINIRINSSLIDIKPTCKIMDLCGRNIKILSPIMSNNITTFIWDGTNNLGKALSSGVYIALIKSQNITLHRKILISK